MSSPLSSLCECLAIPIPVEAGERELTVRLFTGIEVRASYRLIAVALYSRSMQHYVAKVRSEVDGTWMLVDAMRNGGQLGSALQRPAAYCIGLKSHDAEYSSAAARSRAIARARTKNKSNNKTQRESRSKHQEHEQLREQEQYQEQ